MRKSILLLLVVALLLTVATATFTDDKSISSKYRTAVEAMSEKKIIAGFEDGSFKPKDTLTRAQAAKILCTMLAGDSIPAGTTEFSDVPAGHWAEKFVAYCASKGIVSGVGGGKFNPNGKLTGYAFGKMLLAAYGKDGGGLTGTGWDTKTAELLSKNFLDVGVKVTGEPIQRQEACQLAYNFTLPAEDVSNYAETTVELKDMSMVKTYGRTYADEKGIHCDFGASGIEFTLCCAGEVLLTVDATENGYFQCFVDGQEAERIRTSTAKEKKLRVVNDLRPGEHTFRIVKDSDVSTNGATTALATLTFTGDKASLKPTAQKKYYIEYVGDSTMVGKGALTSGTYTSDDPSHSATHAFTYLSAQLLDADWSVYARGGAGYFVTKSVPMAMKDLYDYQNGFLQEPVAYDFARKPDVVVIHLGGNDSSYKGDDFREAFRALEKQIRGHYGADTRIVYAYNNMVATKNELIEELGVENPNSSIVKLSKHNDGGSSGSAVGHPSAASQAINAQELADYLKTILK